VISLLGTLVRLYCEPTSTLGDEYKNTVGLLSGKPTRTLGEHTFGELPGKPHSTMGEHTLEKLPSKPTSTLGEHKLFLILS
jgi:hypothetical protein